MPALSKETLIAADLTDLSRLVSTSDALHRGEPAGGAVSSRWFGVGHSRNLNSYEAGAEAARKAVAGRTAALVIVFAATGHDFEALLAGVRDIAGLVPLVGCSTGGEFTGDGVSMGGVAVTALGGPGFTVKTTVSRDASPRRREAGQEVAASVADVTSPHRILLLLCDGLTREQQEIVRGAYGVVGATVPLVGGCAADLNLYERTVQFYGDESGVEVLSDAVVGAAIGSDAPIGIGVAHGWRKIGEPAVVTSSSGGELYELDGRPALDWYLERLGAPRTVIDDPVEFHTFAFLHPLGLSRRSGEDMRVIHAADGTDGHVTCLTDVPQGALVWLMEADETNLIAAVSDAHAAALDGLAGAAPLGVIAFDCGARLLLLGAEGASREIAELSRLSGDVPVAGFYTYGEIARTRGARGMHHLTLVVLAFA
ncbi:MAG: hypothetical protein QOJ62_1814 [Actinomycetota bacterium]|jgi:hypothetical protein|nr:hypothetical protein [Actinomycetota bacterium]